MTHDAFVDAVQERLQLDQEAEASKLVTAVLETFSEILYRTERDRLSAPLPKELAQRLHAARTEQTRQEIERLNADAFLDRVQARADLNQQEAKTAIREVLSVLGDAIGPDMLSDLGSKLPASYGVLFPFVDRPDSAGPPPA